MCLLPWGWFLGLPLEMLSDVGLLGHDSGGVCTGKRLFLGRSSSGCWTKQMRSAYSPLWQLEIESAGLPLQCPVQWLPRRGRWACVRAQYNELGRRRCESLMEVRVSRRPCSKTSTLAPQICWPCRSPRQVLKLHYCGGIAIPPAPLNLCMSAFTLVKTIFLQLMEVVWSSKSSNSISGGTT